MTPQEELAATETFWLRTAQQAVRTSEEAMIHHVKVGCQVHLESLHGVNPDYQRGFIDAIHGVLVLLEDLKQSHQDKPLIACSSPPWALNPESEKSNE